MKNNNQPKKSTTQKFAFVFLVAMLIFIMVSTICMVYTAVKVSSIDVAPGGNEVSTMSQTSNIVSLSAESTQVAEVPKVLNFNQLFEPSYYFPSVSKVSVRMINNGNGSISFYGTPSISFGFQLGGTKLLVDTHKYFICPNASGTYDSCIKLYTDKFSYKDITNGFLFDSSKILSLYCEVYQGFGLYDFSIQPILIDLTQMFGAGNEPTTLNELYKYIPKGVYFPYNAGTPICGDSGYFQGYQNGVNDTLNSLNLHTTFDQLYERCYVVNPTNFLSSDNAGYVDYNPTDINNTIVFNKAFAVPLQTPIEKDVIVNVSANSILTDGTQSVDVGYLLDGDFIKLGTLDADLNVAVSFSLPLQVSNLIFASGDWNNSSVPSSDRFLYDTTITGIDISYRTFNSQVLIDNAFISGVNKGQSLGYDKGYSDGLSVGSDNRYTFTGLLSAVIKAPITALIGDFDVATGERVGGLLNFEFLGYNMSNLLMSLFSISIVILVVRMFL